MLSHGAAWAASRPLEEQADWSDHAAFMDALVAEGFVLLGGPLEGTSNVLLVIRAENEAEIRRRLGADPWMRNDLLRVANVTPWELRLGSL